MRSLKWQRNEEDIESRLAVRELYVLAAEEAEG
jgi:hypothetical protein